MREACLYWHWLVESSAVVLLLMARPLVRWMDRSNIVLRNMAAFTAVSTIILVAVLLCGVCNGKDLLAALIARGPFLLGGWFFLKYLLYRTRESTESGSRRQDLLSSFFWYIAFLVTVNMVASSEFFVTD